MSTQALCATAAGAAELFATAFERTVLGMGIVATSGRWIEVNDALCHLLGYAREELLTLDFQSLTHPEDLAESLDQQRRLYAGEIDFLRQEKRYRHRDGHYVWVYVTVGLVRDADGRPSRHVTQVQDIDARKRAEAALASAQRAIATSERERLDLLARLNEAQHAAGIGSWSWDCTSGAVWWSDELYRIFELDPAHYTPSVERNAAYVHADDRGPYHALVEQTLAAGKEFEFDLRIVTGRGHERHCRSRGYVERATDGTVLRVFGTFQDRTEARLLEERLREAHRMESLGSLAGGIAHDFNNLLAAILGNVALARAHVDDAQAVTDKLQRIEEAGQRAKSLVDQILSFSQRRPLQLAPVDLCALVRETAGLLRATIPAGIDLVLDLDEKTPAALADASQIHQVLMNLGTNAWLAIRAREAPGGRIEIKVSGIELDSALAGTLDARLCPGPYCRIDVRDDGIGMDAATRVHAFEPFFTTREPGTGSGLGLSVVHGIVTALHGAISVVSTPGTGSCFTLFLPQAAVPAAIPSPAAPREACPPRDAIRRVLYIDDEAALTAFVRELLESDGIDVTTAASADEALDLLRAHGTMFDAIVSDCNMPERSGLTLVRELAAMRNETPVILSSGLVTSELQRDAAALGVRALINKANLVDELPRRLRELAAAR